MIQKTKYLLVAFALLIPALLCAQLKVKIMSFNIRLDVTSDGENQWGKRKEKVASLMNYYEADFIGGQEVQHHQLQYLQGQLKTYNHIGVGRDDGKEEGEYSCIFYKKDRFTAVKQSTFWLSETPDSVSMGWDAACRRVCTYGLFRSNETKQLIWVFNTHLDHMGVTARIESAKLIEARIRQLNAEYNYPVVLMGDFNSKPGDAPVQYLKEHFLVAREISEMPAYGPADTWNGFQFDKTPDGCIDHIFTGHQKNIKVKKFATITDSYDKKYPSDHFPVMATLIING